MSLINDLLRLPQVVIAAWEFKGGMIIPKYKLSTRPDPTKCEGWLIRVEDGGVGGRYAFQFSDGVAWRTIVWT